MLLYPARALERAMKIKEVITRAMSGTINWMQAAEILGMSDRQLRRWRKRWDNYGYDGLFDHRTQRPSPKRVAMVDVEKVLTLYREQYFDLNVKHFVEKLHEQHHIQLSYSWEDCTADGRPCGATSKSEVHTAKSVSGVRWRECCYMSTAAGIDGFPDWTATRT